MKQQELSGGEPGEGTVESIEILHHQKVALNKDHSM